MLLTLLLLLLDLLLAFLALLLLVAPASLLALALFAHVFYVVGIMHTLCHPGKSWVDFQR